MIAQALTSTELLSPSVGRSLLGRLANVSDRPLPARGLLAGGSVANLLLEEAWGVRMPVNDLDIFVDEEVPSDVYSNCPFRCTRYELDDGYQKPVLKAGGYKVLQTRRDGMLNHVLIRRTLAAFGDERYRMVLSGFDLNCCQAGIDLASGRLVWTEAFEKFIISRQLQVCSPVTPMHTAVRLAKKQAELSCYCNLAEELSLLSSYYDACRSRNKLYACSVRFGSKYADMFVQHGNVLRDYCCMVQTSSPVLPGMEALMGSTYTIRFHGLEEHHQRILETLNTGPGFDSCAFVKAFDNMIRSSTPAKRKKRFATLMNFGGVPAITALLRPQALDGNLERIHLEVIERFSIRHPKCMKTILGLELSIFEQVRAIRMLGRFANIYGQVVYGLLETAQVYGFLVKEISEDVLNNLMEIYRSLGSEELVKQLELGSFVHKRNVAELISKADLRIEGSRMHHCVGGYWPALATGRTRIFHIETDDGYVTTAAFWRCSNNEYQNKEEKSSYDLEIFGSGNSEAPAEHIGIARSLGNYLLETIWNNEPITQTEEESWQTTNHHNQQHLSASMMVE